ncbi:MAG: hypothetical protein A2293_11745 [Elusimicrobia bacterium RIFOXYB2_FULL_49_7]|nr:MAG: hypothetical protein A2293_11745 [Elusimicrobia bacterium RIFOXYB2_FULL_49_7]
MNFLFHYMARWKAINWTRYHYLLTNLAEMGHDVYVLQPPSLNLQETNFQEIEAKLPPRLHLIDMELNNLLWESNLPLNKLVKKGYYSIASMNKVKDLVRSEKIDVAMFYNLPQYPIMESVSCIKIFDYADDYLPMLQHELGIFGNGLIMKYAKRVLDNMIQKADLTMAVSTVLADSIQTARGNVKVLPNGVDISDFELAASGKRYVECPKPIVGFIGAFEYFIDFDLILDVAQRMPRCTFLLVGSGRQLGYVQDQVKTRGLRNVILTGGVPHAQIANYIREMDVCLNVFKKIAVSHSACPIKLFEYMIMKKPVISTRLHEVQKIDESFILYADTAQEFVDSISMIVDNKTDVSGYVQRGYDTTVQKYSWKSITLKLLHWIDDIKRGSRSKVIN